MAAGLLVAGVTSPTTTPRPSEIIKRNTDLLLAWQQPSGGWEYQHLLGSTLATLLADKGHATTALCALALMEASGFKEDTARRQAVERAQAYLMKGLSTFTTPLREHVLGWGWIYGLALFLGNTNQEGIRHCLAAFSKWETRGGGWSYSTTQGIAGPHSFMTAAALKILREVQVAGYEVPKALLTRGVKQLETLRDKDGAFAYELVMGGRMSLPQFPNTHPEASARGPLCEAALFAAGKGSVDRLKTSLDLLIRDWAHVHARWQAKDANVTPHAGPHRIAPYFALFGLWTAAQTLEVLPEADRPAYRDKLLALLLPLEESGKGWSDLPPPFGRNEGTAMAMLALLALEKP